MNISRRFRGVFFQPPVIREAFSLLETLVRKDPILGAYESEYDKSRNPALLIKSSQLSIYRGDETVTHDNEEEFFADYRKGVDRAEYKKNIGACWLEVFVSDRDSHVQVDCKSRAVIDAVLNTFEESSSANRLPEPERTPPIPPKLFIGHGHSKLWRELKDHLTEKHGLDVIAYEVGARAGHTIRDILEDMLSKSSMAFLVLSGEDTDSSGQLHARENVVHETGLFQGRLGFSRAIVLLEEGTAEFSNIQGIDQVRFSKGNIKETFGEVLATIRREFGALP